MANVVRIAETRAMLNALGPRPDSKLVEDAREALDVIDDYLAQQLEALSREAKPPSTTAEEWESIMEKLPYKSTIQLDELHRLYSGMLKSAESSPFAVPGSPIRSPMRPLYITDDIDDDVARVLQDAFDTRSDKLLLSSRRVACLPESLGRIKSLSLINLSTNCLEALPDSLSQLSNLITLDVSSNQLTTLPDSIRSLKKLRFLNVSGNALKSLPDSLALCFSLVELNASFNQLEKLPPNIGSLFNLEKLSLQLNKLSMLPASIGDLTSLKVLEIHFNKLVALPSSIGNLKDLEVLNCSSNFNSLTTVPSSLGDLYCLRELDLSYNQIRELPLSFGRLQKLRKLKLDQNPLVVPPPEVVDHSLEAVLEYMAEKWRSSMKLDDEHDRAGSNTPARVVTNGGSRVISWLGGMCAAGTEFRRPSSKVLSWHRSPDRYLEQL
ncbi:hypothetical protein SELMODRAFT_110183 [Selaginella moellendorffii]|uniref:Uncharacterized protein n=1 Tax=Selaginella moellendorffii TaxID=88036 RepID=D8S7G4_SELML|nr:hypothetical protein SELMODRAFT_135145 [Selaginella moellendorffii]EFJ19601.1 hypothetical protein SELMODRAFT_110183 [Selaginella moellendorffii]